MLFSDLRPGEQVEINFPMVTAKEKLVYYVYHKPQKPMELTF